MNTVAVIYIRRSQNMIDNADILIYIFLWFVLMGANKQQIIIDTYSGLSTNRWQDLWTIYATPGLDALKNHRTVVLIYCMNKGSVWLTFDGSENELTQSFSLQWRHVRSELFQPPVIRLFV